jgi:hypothetical protein
MAEVEPIIIDIKHPGTCQFCRNFDNKTKALLLPWRQNEGWWSCMECKDKATKRMQIVMDGRRIMGISAFPDWFRQHGLFAVKRSDNTLTEMFLVDFECEFSNNIGNVGNSEGRVRLSNNDIFVDMCTSDNKFFKQVALSNLYENNAALHDYGPIQFLYPSYVSNEAKIDWHAAAETASLKKKSIDVPEAPSADTVDGVDLVTDPTIDPMTDPDTAIVSESWPVTTLPDDAASSPPVEFVSDISPESSPLPQDNAASNDQETLCSQMVIDNTQDATVILESAHKAFRFW